MDQYVRHFLKVYTDSLRMRTPLPAEIITLEKYAAQENDDLVQALGERLGYLRRTSAFTEHQSIQVTAFLSTHVKLGQAVQAADARAQLKRTTVTKA